MCFNYLLDVGRGRGITQMTPATQKPGNSTVQGHTVGRGVLRMHNAGDSSVRGSRGLNAGDNAAQQCYKSGRPMVAGNSSVPQQNIGKGQFSHAGMGVGRGKLS